MEDSDFQPIIKRFVKDKPAPQTIAQIEFGTLSADDVSKLSHVEVVNRDMYQQGRTNPNPYGVLDLRMGSSQKGSTCATCKQQIQECIGHCGQIKLALPVFHIGYLKEASALFPTPHCLSLRQLC